MPSDIVIPLSTVNNASGKIASLCFSRPKSLSVLPLVVL